MQGPGESVSSTPSGALARVHAHAPVGKSGAAFYLRLGFALAATAILIGGHADERVKTFSLVFVSIVLEAVPFMLLGSAISGLIEVFVSKDRLAALLPRRKAVTTLVAATAGMVFPVCECAVVPVVRRFLRKGVPFSAAVAYLLAGPIFNPIVGASTAVAYSVGPVSPLLLAGLRLLGGLLVAVVVGLVMGRIFDRRSALTGALTTPENGQAQSDDVARPPFGVRLLVALRHGGDEFLDIAQYLIVGAFVAAAAQTFVSRQVFLELAGTPVAAILVFMALAVALNLCSEADAFVAASFRTSVPLSAQMAFMVLGPMLDVKLVVMYLGVFRKQAILVLITLVFLGVLGYILLLGGILPDWFGALPGGGAS
jgi:uncharacterized membrane protein YraQ (UPF0718 family)